MKIIQSRSFKRKVKKIGKQDKKVLDKQILEIVKTPYLGTEKKGDHRGVFDHKIK
jgi:mRNA interferase RelE/StbE